MLQIPARAAASSGKRLLSRLSLLWQVCVGKRLLSLLSLLWQVYVGWARINDPQLPDASRGVHKAVLSIGWNPFYDNKQRTVEAYICHEIPGDFYGAQMQLLICGFLRPQANFDSMEQLIEAITADVEFGKELLDDAAFDFRADAHFEAR